jgi:uncharacterized protein YbbC (DUF1343 family)
MTATTATTTLTGLDVLVKSGMGLLRGKRVALLGHPASVDRRFVHLLDACRDAGVPLVRLFGPEHGLLGDAQDMDHVGGHQDGRTGLDVVSLYGPTRASLFLAPAMLDGVDVLVCDLQDVGARYYTFAYTIAFALRACAEKGVTAVVLDRPNPIGGVRVEGNVVEDGFRSFVGEYPLANRHGLTIGELCRSFAAHDGIADRLRLEVVWMEGHDRARWHAETGAPWVLPSPNMPTPDTAAVYVGGCLFEGTNLSEGRGTTRPFELVGAPYIDDPHRLASLAAAQGVPGAVLRPCFFRPTFQKHAGKLCGGLQVHVVDRGAFDSLRAGVAIVHAARAFAGFDWRRTPYEYVSDRLAIDLLFGSAEPRTALERGATTEDVMASFEPARTRFVEQRAAWLHPGYGSKGAV